MTYTAKVIQGEIYQEILLPKEVQLDTNKITIEIAGDTLIIRPERSNKWDKWFEKAEEINAEDYLID